MCAPVVPATVASGHFEIVTKRSQTWAPDHFYSDSRSWPIDHKRERSDHWPANHFGPVSLTWPSGHDFFWSETWPKDHTDSRSETWPVNHTGTISLTWSEDHTLNASQGWPADHTSGFSSIWPSGHDLNISETWPTDHPAAWSSSWPRDHYNFNSRNWPNDHETEPSQSWPPNERPPNASTSGTEPGPLALLVSDRRISDLSPQKGLDAGAAYPDTNSVKLDLIGAVDLEDVERTFAQVLTALGDEVNVYPTENYFYYRFGEEDSYIWGNIRLAPSERDNGYVHFAYFEFNEDPQGPGDFYSKHQKFGPGDGVRLTKEHDFRYNLSYRGSTVVFNLGQVEQHAPELFRLRPSEFWLQNTHDESGLNFHLVYNQDTSTFMWILNEETDYPEVWNTSNERLVLGECRPSAIMGHVRGVENPRV